MAMFNVTLQEFNDTCSNLEGDTLKGRLKVCQNIFQSFARKRVLSDFFTNKVLTDFLEEAVYTSFVEKNGIMICNISKIICQIVPRPCFRTDLKVDRTRNRMRVAIESGKGMKVKVLQLC